MASLDYRRDVRSTDVFSDNIEDFTEREKYWSLALRQEFVERGHPANIHENGVDNTGKLISGKLANYNADKTFVFGDGREVLIEIKTCPEYLNSFFTFKAYSLRSCVEQGAYMIVPRMVHYYTFSPKAVQKLLDEYPPRLYPKFSANDLAVRIPMGHLETWVENRIVSRRTWMPLAQEFVNTHKDILTREKRR